MKVYSGYPKEDPIRKDHNFSQMNPNQLFQPKTYFNL